MGGISSDLGRARRVARLALRAHRTGILGRFELSSALPDRRAIRVAAELGLELARRGNPANARHPCQGPTALKGCEDAG